MMAEGGWLDASGLAASLEGGAAGWLCDFSHALNSEARFAMDLAYTR